MLFSIFDGLVISIYLPTSTRTTFEMRLPAHLWQICLFASTFVLSSMASVVLDTFKDVKLGSCSCTFTMTQNDDGLVDVKNAACNKKCSKKSIGATLGGPASESNLYRIQINVARGSVTVVRMAATLVCPTESTTTPPETQPSPPPPSPLLPPTEGTGGAEPLPQPVFTQKSGPFCDRFESECRDRTSFPNIGQAFRGYNLFLGDPLNYGGDPGFQSHIFSEAGERNGGIRFGNTAGNDLNRCDGSVRADFIETSEEFLESIMRSSKSRKTFQLGSEIEITASFNGQLDANLGVGGNGGLGGVGLGNGPVGPQGGLEIGGVGGVSAGATVTIPPLLQVVTSNSRVMAELSEGLESNQISITRSSFSCYEYEFEITQYQHPVFTGTT